eukprot:SM000168S02614  [mRNA]  locus=s168:195126:195833:+ [translate_table: standard]
MTDVTPQQPVIAATATAAPPPAAPAAWLPALRRSSIVAAVVAALLLLTAAAACGHSSDSGAAILRSHAESAQDVLAAHGLPAGLLPDDVAAYRLKGNGRFEVHLHGECYASIGDQATLVHYSSKIIGVLGDGRIQQLTGIQAKPLWLWLQVTSIYVDRPSSGDIHFSVGILSEALPLSSFRKSPVCMRIGSWGLLERSWRSIPIFYRLAVEFATRAQNSRVGYKGRKDLDLDRGT